MNQKDINKIIDNGNMIYCFDIDDTLVKMITELEAKPIKSRIKYVNSKYKKGDYIILYTARSDRIKKETIEMLKSFNVLYNELIMNKPKAHIYIDDCTINTRDYFKKPEEYDSKFKLIGNKINKIIRNKI